MLAGLGASCAGTERKIGAPELDKLLLRGHVMLLHVPVILSDVPVMVSNVPDRGLRAGDG